MSEWVSVKDKLPDKVGMYLVYGKTNLVRIKWFCARNIRSKDKDDHKLRFISGSGTDCKITTHWMPLPEPPKE